VEAEAKSKGRSEAGPPNVCRNAGYRVAVAPQIEVHDFTFYRHVRRQAELGTQSSRPADIGPGIAAGGAPHHRQDRGWRIGRTRCLSAISRDRRSAL